MIVFDVETDGFLDKATKIHVLSYTRDGVTFSSLHGYEEMRELLAAETILIGHNIMRFDIPVLEKILSIKIKAKLYDTLPMSWVINLDRPSHGLESFGIDFGVPKPVITDWGGSDQGRVCSPL